jgi:hypothetical protein
VQPAYETELVQINNSKMVQQRKTFNASAIRRCFQPITERVQPEKNKKWLVLVVVHCCNNRCCAGSG